MAKFEDIIILKDGASYTLQEIMNNSFKAEKKVASLQQKLNNVGKSMKNFGKSASLYVTTPIIAMGTYFAKSAMEMQLLTTEMTTFLASKEKANKLIRDIQVLAVKTPMTSKDLNLQAKQLLAYNYDQNKVVNTLRMLGDVAGGNSVKFDRLGYAFAQTVAEGRLLGRDLMQYTQQGFNPLQQIIERTGESMSELRKRMSQGKVSLQEVEQALIDATSEGGRFYQNMDKMSKTAEGRLSTLKDSFQLLAIDLGMIFLPALASVTEHLIKAVEWFKGLDTSAQKAILIVGGLTAAIPPLALAIGTLTLAMSPLALKITTVALAAYGIYEAGKAMGEAFAWVVIQIQKLIEWLDKATSKLSRLKQSFSMSNIMGGGVGLGKSIVEFVRGDKEQSPQKTIAKSVQQTPINRTNNKNFTQYYNFSGAASDQSSFRTMFTQMIGEFQTSVENTGNFNE